MWYVAPVAVSLGPKQLQEREGLVQLRIDGVPCLLGLWAVRQRRFGQGTLAARVFPDLPVSVLAAEFEVLWPHW